MVQKQFSVDLDIKRSTSNREFEVVDGDNGNTLVVTLTDDGQPVNMTDCFILAVFSKSDGRTAAQDSRGGGIEIDPTQANRINIALYMTSFAPGLVECELQIYSGEGERVLVTSAKFNFMCRRGIANSDTIPETQEWPILVEMLDRVEDVEEGLSSLNEATAQAAATAHAAANRANEAATHAEAINADMEAAEAARKLNEQGRAAKEGERQNAETVRAQAETARNTNESAREATESARISAETARGLAEAGRASAEGARAQAEFLRTNAEGSRALAEHDRQNAEAARIALHALWTDAEAERREAEIARVGAEAARALCEDAREGAEDLRAGAEAMRGAAETTRLAQDAIRTEAEHTRVLNETARMTAEEARAQAELLRAGRDADFHLWGEYDPASSYVTLNKVAHKGSSYLCVAPVQGAAPPNPAYWLLIAAKGSDGSGSGDMLRATYDTDDSGVVDDAERLGGRPASAYLIQESDPTVPEWAKQPSKPVYTASEIGAVAASALDAHALDTDNPHGVTAAQAGAADISHAHAHAANGDDAISPESIGAARPSLFITATLTAGGWSQTAPYVQTMALEGMDADANAVFDLAIAATDEQFEAGKAAALTAYAQGEGTLTVRARGELPGVDIPLDILIVG